MSLSIFDYTDYKAYVQARIQALPKQGRGEFRKIAKVLKVHTTLLSQIFRGSKDLSLEQAIGLAKYLGITPLETEFFLLLVQYARAGTKELSQFLKEQIRRIQTEKSGVERHIPRKDKISDVDAAIFYGQWVYSAIRQLSAIPEYQNILAISHRLNIPMEKLRPMVDFLTNSGLCVEEAGTLKIGPKHTHVSRTSSLVIQHHRNWRVKALHTIETINEEREFSFTSPMTLAIKDLPIVKGIILEAIGKISTLLEDSDSETLSCLNIDFFDVR